MAKTDSKRVVSNSIIYTISGLLQKCFSFFLLPLYTAYLTTEDYGITSLSSTFIMTMSFIVSLSLFNSIMRFYVDYKNDQNKLKRFYGTVTNFVLLSSVIWFILLTLFRVPLSHFVFSDIDYYPIIAVTLLSLAFNCQHTIYTYILRSEQRALKASVLDIVYFLISVAINIYFVVGLKLGALGVVLTSCIANFLYMVYFFFDVYISKKMSFCFDHKMLKSALSYSIPLIPHNLASQIAQLVSKVLIIGVNSMGDLGLFTVASQFGVIADTIQTYIHQAYQPWLFEKLASWEDENKKSIRKVSNLLCGFIGLFFIGIALFSQDYIVLFVDKRYITSWHFVPLIVAVYAIKTMYYFYISVIFYDKKATKILFVASVSGSVLNIFLSAFFIPLFGVYGSILADAIAMVIRVVIIYVICKIKCSDSGIRLIDFVINLLVVLFFMFGGLTLSYYKYQDSFSIVNFIFKISVVLVYVVLQVALYHKEIKKLIISRKLKKGA